MEETRAAAGNNYRFQFAYTQGDLPTAITYPGGWNGEAGETVETDYYWQTGQPKRLVGDSVYVDEASYRDHGQLSRLDLANDIYTVYTYDAALRLGSLLTRAPGTDHNGRFRLTLSYDKVGNVISILEITNNWQRQDFTYDSLNRLVKAETNDKGAGQYEHTYEYDPLGNLTKKAGMTMGYGQPHGSDFYAKPHAVTHLDEEQKFWYDHNGNMTCRIDQDGQHWRLEWTVKNQLKQATRHSGHHCTSGANNPVETVSFTYDADGMMVHRQDNGQESVFLGKLYQHNLHSNEETVHYVFNGQLVAMRVGSSVSFLLTDHLGSVNVVLWANGTVRSRIRYDPWGQVRWYQNVTPTGYRYTAQRWDDGLGLYDYHARYYDPHIGRFISADIFVQYSENPQNYSRYTYVLNNPLIYTDPTGYLTQQEIEDYFGFSSREEMLDAGWALSLVELLWDPIITWGHVFSYDDGLAMLVLFEAVQHGSGLYEGGFWGLDGDRRGMPVYASHITFANGHSEAAVNAREFYNNNWSSLPKRTGTDGYNNYDPTTYIDIVTVGTIGATASVVGVGFLLVSNPVGWAAIAAGAATLVSGSIALHQWTTDGFAHHYPVMRQPSLRGNAPLTLHAFSPGGFYR